MAVATSGSTRGSSFYPQTWCGVMLTLVVTGPSGTASQTIEVR
jgi:hypothetical protein